MVTGEDVIAEVLEKDTFLELKNAYRIVMSPEGLGMMPFMLFSTDKQFEVSKTNILAMGEPETEIRNAYSSQTGGVVIPKNNMLITE